MLSIYWGVTGDSYYYIDGEFEEVFEYEWFDDPLVKEIIADIDNCEYNNMICTDLTNPEISFPVNGLSTGSKGLVMLLKMEYSHIRIWGTAFGDNCSRWLLKIAEKKNITLELQHFLKFPEEQFKAYSLLQKREFIDYNDYTNEVINWGFELW